MYKSKTKINTIINKLDERNIRWIYLHDTECENYPAAIELKERLSKFNPAEVLLDYDSSFYSAEIQKDMRIIDADYNANYRKLVYYWADNANGYIIRFFPVGRGKQYEKSILYIEGYGLFDNNYWYTHT